MQFSGEILRACFVLNVIVQSIADQLYVKCEFLPPNTKKGDNLPSPIPIDIQDQKAFTFRGAWLPGPQTTGSALDPAGGSDPV